VKEVTMNTPEVRTQSKPRTAHQNIWRFKEELEIKTATLTEKVNRWLHEHLAMKTPVKLLGGLALGALVMAATALPLGTTYADEPARPLSSEQNQCYPEDRGMCLYGPLAEVLPDPALVAARPLSSEQSQCNPDDNAICLYGLLAEDLPDPALTTGTSISGVQFEDWPEAGLDSYADQRFMVEQGKLEQAKARNRLYSEQIEFIQELELMGMPWRIDDEGKVVVVEASLN
jgi:hypothetical protein